MDDAQLQQAVEDLGKANAEFRKTYDEALEKKADKGEIGSDLTEKLDKIETELEKKGALLETAAAKMQAEAKSANDKIEALETALARSGPGTDDPKAELEIRSQACEMILTDHYDMGRPIDLLPEDVDAADVEAFKLYSKHFPTYLRRDSGVFLRKMSVEKLETKLLSVDRDPGGGYWVKPEVSNRIVTKVFETSPVRQFAMVENIGSDSLEILADEDEAASGWVAEQESRSQTDTPDIGVRKIHAHELYAKPRATQKLLDDAGFDVEGWLARKVSEKFARDEATAFVTGTGVGRPRGFTTYADGTSTGTIEQIASGAAQLLTADGIFNLVYALKGPYLPNARFMGARLTHRDIRKLKDGDGRYLWEPIFKVGQPATLIGYPIHQADDMASVSGGNLALAFGDFKAAYTIVDRKGIRVLRDPYTAKPYVVFYTTRRVGGDVVNFEAIKLQDIAAS